MGLRITCADLSSRDGELLLTQLAVAGVLVLQPNLTPLKQGIFLLSGFFYTFYTTHKTTNMRCYAHDGRTDAVLQYSLKLIYQHPKNETGFTVICSSLLLYL